MRALRAALARVAAMARWVGGSLHGLRSETGQGLAEYALILALIIIIAVVALIFLGGQVKTILSTGGGSVST
jgi:pilus assembly protein Flp/PilA